MRTHFRLLCRSSSQQSNSCVLYLLPRNAVEVVCQKLRLLLLTESKHLICGITTALTVYCCLYTTRLLCCAEGRTQNPTRCVHHSVQANNARCCIPNTCSPHQIEEGSHCYATHEEGPLLDLGQHRRRGHRITLSETQDGGGCTTLGREYSRCRWH